MTIRVRPATTIPRRMTRFLVLVLLIALPHIACATDALTLACETCHGSAQAPSGMPSFFAMDEVQIAAQLRAYRDGALGGTAMPRIAAGLSDSQINALAKYFSHTAP